MLGAVVGEQYRDNAQSISGLKWEIILIEPQMRQTEVVVSKAVLGAGAGLSTPAVFLLGNTEPLLSISRNMWKHVGIRPNHLTLNVSTGVQGIQGSLLPSRALFSTRWLRFIWLPMSGLWWSDFLAGFLVKSAMKAAWRSIYYRLSAAITQPSDHSDSDRRHAPHTLLDPPQGRSLTVRHRIQKFNLSSQLCPTF